MRYLITFSYDGTNFHGLERQVGYRTVQEEMENVYKLDVPLKVEIDTGINWYEAK